MRCAATATELSIIERGRRIVKYDAAPVSEYWMWRGGNVVPHSWAGACVSVRGS